MAIGNGVSFALHLIVVQTEAEDRATQIRGEPTKKVFSAMELRKGPSVPRTHWAHLDLYIR